MDPPGLDPCGTPKLVRGPARIEPAYRHAHYVRGAVEQAEETARAILADAERTRLEIEATRPEVELEAIRAGRARLGAVVRALEVERERLEREYEQDVIATASAIVSALLDVDESCYGEAIASLAGAALASVRFESEVVVRASPRAAPALEWIRNEVMLPRADGSTTPVVADPALPDGSICIDTSHGRRQFSLRARCRRIRQEAARRREAGTAPHAMAAQPSDSDPKAHGGVR